MNFNLILVKVSLLKVDILNKTVPYISFNGLVTKYERGSYGKHHIDLTVYLTPSFFICSLYFFVPKENLRQTGVV